MRIRINGQRTTDNGRRAGFTLVELLVVIAIIAILFSLTSAAVIRVLGVAEDTSNRTDISKLEVAVKAVESHYGVTYLPSSIRLSETGNYDLRTVAATGAPLNPFHFESVTFIKQMWPSIQTVPTPNASTHGTLARPGGIDWNGDGTIGGDWDLQGDQCLVFWTGGIPARPPLIATTGFSVNKRDPSYHTRGPGLGSEVVQPFYEFKSNRLVSLHGNSFYSYLDGYSRSNGAGGLVRGAPYAYFSSYKSGNDYRLNDCNLLQVRPYVEPPGTAPFRYHNATGFQIISAGLDGLFGQHLTMPGNPVPWSPSSGSSVHPRGRDDQANFHDRKLGS